MQYVNRNHKKLVSNLIIMAISLTAFSAVAIAGNEGGTGAHGGSGIICGNQVELAEFREVLERPGLKNILTITQSTTPVDEQIASAIFRLRSIDPVIADKVEKNIREIRSVAMPMIGYDWGFSNDVNYYPVPDSCELRTIVHYWADDMIEYRSDLYNKLSPTAQAGLWVHEGVFKLYRDSTRDNLTLPTRRIVALLFANENLTSFLKQMVKKSLTDQTETYWVSIPQSEMEIPTKFTADGTNRFEPYRPYYFTSVTDSPDQTITNNVITVFPGSEFSVRVVVTYVGAQEQPYEGKFTADLYLISPSKAKYNIPHISTLVPLRENGRTRSGGTKYVRVIVLTQELRNFELGK
jgi:hypothetical protein